MGKTLTAEIKQYLIITGNYWAFTLTDGALRMLVVLYFHQLGFTPLAIASLFLFYEFFGVVTNLVGGWLGARIGLNKTMNIGLLMQVIALTMLVVPTEYLTVAYVMVAQALSGVAKDLNKMSAKSAIKVLVPKNAEGALFKWVAILTGSKNTLKGVGFFVGGLLLTLIGFKASMVVMACLLACIWLASILLLKSDLGKARTKTKFTKIFSKSRNLNLLSAARMFLFASRDVWFVVALPVYLSQQFDWDHWSVGGMMAAWVIAYGVVQVITPKLLMSRTQGSEQSLTNGFNPKVLACYWGMILGVLPLIIITASCLGNYQLYGLLIGLFVFGFVFAINSSLHSYLIVSIAERDTASLDVGFYYMANAAGRLFGTVLSGFIFQRYGLTACLWVSSLFIFIAVFVTYLMELNSVSVD